ALGAVKAEGGGGLVAGMAQEDVEVLDDRLPLAVGGEARERAGAGRSVRRRRLFGDEGFKAVGDVVVEHGRGIEGGIVGRIVHGWASCTAAAAAAGGEGRALGAGVGGEVAGPVMAAEAEVDGALAVDEAEAAGAGAAAAAGRGRIEEGQGGGGVAGAAGGGEGGGEAGVVEGRALGLRAGVHPDELGAAGDGLVVPEMVGALDPIGGAGDVGGKAAELLAQRVGAGVVGGGALGDGGGREGGGQQQRQGEAADAHGRAPGGNCIFYISGNQGKTDAARLVRGRSHAAAARGLGAWRWARTSRRAWAWGPES